eukprot:CAMPEP_0113691866 /NCGR_PEP_ID=MMETSP0038_2-20120614/18731_1 /TAXON_ID=2898 /ORGANISM="Cryptomonas paramecium" /LENGTH=118 /DNA_ID=CAMNT_0000613643 /DNA_START=255 /DNA_END=610 /DNA_ORIENTATION=- /assembly_acc=CAM_ASM_000170
MDPARSTSSAAREKAGAGGEAAQVRPRVQAAHVAVVDPHDDVVQLEAARELRGAAVAERAHHDALAVHGQRVDAQAHGPLAQAVRDGHRLLADEDDLLVRVDHRLALIQLSNTITDPD